ncbi:hypothetical protein RhiirC2_801997 [Rhizophagus irregularis]|uniref:Uncharacterized protein n=1 Tax=Rhizophagus irregularis TaxID=588596 RepID=A0A2N1M1Q0_9GLOM|nr:hypothetical protein RhiirC2_801997 [Rhizophagus irregularis]
MHIAPSTREIGIYIRQQIGYSWIKGNQIGIKGKRLNIESSIQSDIGDQHPQYKIRHPNCYRRSTTLL